MELFTPCKEIYSDRRKAAVYGFNHFTKASLLFLAMHNIYISAFFVERGETKCTEYLGKKVLAIEELGDAYHLYDLFGEHTESLRIRGIEADRLLNCGAGRQVVIYGAGAYGKMCHQILLMYGVDVKAFCDQDKNKTGHKICGCEIISKDLLGDYKYCDLVIGLDTDQARLLENELSDQCRPEKIFYNNWSEHYVCAGNYIDPFIIFYIRQRSGRMTLTGYKEDICLLSGMLKNFDISINRAVDCDGYTGICKQISFVDQYELAYEEDPSALYCILERGKEKTGRFAQELGFKRSQFVFSFKTTAGNFDAVLDANMGYNKYESIAILNSGAGNDLKIGVLGGSTSDTDLYGETSWTEYLPRILEEQGINAVIYTGAEKGYSSSQELMKLCRDMILYNPDLIISYSGVNDHPAMTCRKNVFIANWQEEFFHAIMRSSLDVNKSSYVEGTRKAFCYGEKNNNYGESWIRNERMMHGICGEFGIKFHAVFQPNLFSKKTYSSTEQELMEIVSYMYTKEELSQDLQILNEKKEQIEKLKKKNHTDSSWLTDFSEIFEDYEGITYFDRNHVFEEANYYLASKIFSLIETDIRDILKRK